jgi:hypothetical protein
MSDKKKGVDVSEMERKRRSQTEEVKMGKWSREIKMLGKTQLGQERPSKWQGKRDGGRFNGGLGWAWVGGDAGGPRFPLLIC